MYIFISMARLFWNFISIYNISNIWIFKIYQFIVISSEILIIFISINTNSVKISIQYISHFLSVWSISVFVYYLKFISMPLSVWSVFHFLSVFGYQYTDKKCPKMVILKKKKTYGKKLMNWCWNITMVIFTITPDLKINIVPVKLQK